jgi:hypothetical protein
MKNINKNDYGDNSVIENNYENNRLPMPKDINLGGNSMGKHGINSVAKTMGKPKGTVLYTVVTVMMILLIFVLVTLGISSTANNRAYNTYYKNQTYYSAKSLVESVVDGVTDKSSTSNLSGVLGNIGDSTTTLAVGTPINGTTDEYRLPNGMGTLKGGVKVISAGSDLTGTENFVDGTGNPVLKIEATVELGGQESTYSRYIRIGGVYTPSTDNVDPGFVSLGNMSNTAVGHSVIGGTSSMVYAHQYGVKTGLSLTELLALEKADATRNPDDMENNALENAKAGSSSLNSLLVYNCNIVISDGSDYRIAPKGGFIFNGHLVSHNGFTARGVYQNVVGGIDKVKTNYTDMPWIYIRGSFFSRSGGNNIGYRTTTAGIEYAPVNLVVGQLVGRNQNATPPGGNFPYSVTGGHALRGVLPEDFYGDVYMMNVPDANYLEGGKAGTTPEVAANTAILSKTVYDAITDNKYEGQDIISVTPVAETAESVLADPDNLLKDNTATEYDPDGAGGSEPYTGLTTANYVQIPSTTSGISFGEFGGGFEAIGAGYFYNEYPISSIDAIIVKGENVAAILSNTVVAAGGNAAEPGAEGDGNTDANTDGNTDANANGEPNTDEEQGEPGAGEPGNEEPDTNGVVDLNAAAPGDATISVGELVTADLDDLTFAAGDIVNGSGDEVLTAADLEGKKLAYVNDDSTLAVFVDAGDTAITLTTIGYDVVIPTQYTITYGAEIVSDAVPGSHLAFSEANVWEGDGAGVNGGTTYETYIKGVSVIGTDGGGSLINWTSDFVNQIGGPGSKQFGNWYSKGSILYYMGNSNITVGGETIIHKQMLTWGNTNNSVTFKGSLIVKGGLVMLDNSRATINAEQGIYVNINQSLFKGGYDNGTSFLRINGVNYSNFTYNGVEYTTAPNNTGAGNYEDTWMRNGNTRKWEKVSRFVTMKAFISAANLEVEKVDVDSDAYKAELGRGFPAVSGDKDYISYIYDQKVSASLGSMTGDSSTYFDKTDTDSRVIKARVSRGDDIEDVYYQSSFEYKGEVNYKAPILYMWGDSNTQDLQRNESLSEAQKSTNAATVNTAAVTEGDAARTIISTKFGYGEGNIGDSYTTNGEPFVITGDVTLVSPCDNANGMDSKTLFIDPGDSTIKVNLVNWQTKNGSRIVVYKPKTGGGKVEFYVPAMPDELRDGEGGDDIAGVDVLTEGGFGNEYFGPNGGNGTQYSGEYEKDGNFTQLTQLNILTSYYDNGGKTLASVDLAVYPDDPQKIPNINFFMNGDGDCRLQNCFVTAYFRMPYATFGFRDQGDEVHVNYFLNDGTTTAEGGGGYDKYTGEVTEFGKPSVIGSMVVGSFDLGNKRGTTDGSTGNQFVVVYINPVPFGDPGSNDSSGVGVLNVDSITRVMD